VALGGIAKRKGVPSHLREMLVGNAVTTGHHARAVSSSYSLERKRNKTKSKKALNEFL
jgi:hypothetical protein